MKPDIGRDVRSKQADQVAHHDHHSKYRSFQIGEVVLAKNFRPGAPWVKGKIFQQLGPLTFQVEVEQSLCWKRHIDHLKKLSSAPLIRDDQDDSPYLGLGSHEEAPPTTTEHTMDDEPNTAPAVEDTPNATPTPSTPDRSKRRYPVRNRRPPDRYFQLIPNKVWGSVV